MIVDVELVIADGAERPPEGTPIRIEARDTTYVDVASPVVAEAVGHVSYGPQGRLAPLRLELPAEAPSNLTLWAHVDVDQDERVSLGDFVTTVAHAPAESATGAPQLVPVKQV